MDADRGHTLAYQQWVAMLGCMTWLIRLFIKRQHDKLRLFMNHEMFAYVVSASLLLLFFDGYSISLDWNLIA